MQWLQGNVYELLFSCIQQETSSFSQFVFKYVWLKAKSLTGSIRTDAKVLIADSLSNATLDSPTVSQSLLCGTFPYPDPLIFQTGAWSTPTRVKIESTDRSHSLMRLEAGGAGIQVQELGNSHLPLPWYYHALRSHKFAQVTSLA